MKSVRPMSIRSGQRRVLALISTVGCLAAGCTAQPQNPNAIEQGEAIKRLDYRLQQLESRIDSGATERPDQGDKTPPGPVKSLTLRLGTVDDRLRIYWEDGTTTNLPCTEEQKTWVCG